MEYTMIVNIPPPVQVTRQRGVFSRRHAHPISVRFHELDVKLINDVANLYGVTPSTFIRWVTLHAAMEMYRTKTGKDVKVML